ncbi:LysM peptidoglycan-binding domain-containing protein [Phaeobacter gallaeciensis]|uniref:LysM domain protein n=1 Tax=Phaeobacter gallaeciensis TaxID=60890 RepID=A0AAC9Z8I0_9RHOB|nr:LysM peptidoglycan-binding domain-containing protein [Phaeobacter gallaeciensis]AHD09250.1 LysM domain protein [Phaeobacter gallaeciensis DSM 26640]ATE92513.1 LysM domain protein [Phaeobacter gallaeciensis]ATE97665.1 LysM domain protein [Phaeobacter gallaeciensis]ATF01178.1 LysM domain protein [Phaeobacter gallaeciensis]ATF05558.1 LysM domain protein [Phaeobacter gallaeciensis]
MTDVTGKGGLSATAIGGAAAVVVVLGGVIFLQWGASEQTEAPRSTAGTGDSAVISPSASSDGARAVLVPAEEAPVVQTPAVTAEADSTDATAPAGEDAAEDVADGDTSAQAATDASQDKDDGLSLSAPQMDLARFETDGSGMVAGRATPGAVVSLLLDGVVVERLTVPSDGSFVLFTTVAPSTRPQVLSLEAVLGEAVLPSDAQFILAPVAQVEVAEAPIAEKQVADEAVTSEQATGEQAADAASAVALEGDRPAGGTADTDIKLSGTQEASDGDIAVASPKLAEAVEAAADAPTLPTVEVGEASSKTDDPAVAAAAGDASDVTLDETVTAADNTPAAETQAVSAGDDSRDEAQDVGPVQVAEVDEPQSDKTPETGKAPDDAPAQRAVLRSDASGVTLVQPPTPSLAEAPEAVALDTISYDAEGAVVLSGRVRSDAVVRAYLDNAAVADLPVDEEGRWSGILPDVAPGIYALRLDALDGEGKVLSRLETPFKREAPEVLQPPVETAATDPATPDAAPTGAKPLVRLVTVQEGDTLWAISRERYGDGLLYVRVFDANRQAIRDPDLIYPGQVFSVPVQ